MISTFFLVFWMLVFIEQDTKTFYSRKKLTSFPFVSILVPAYNEEAHIEETLTKLAELDYPADKHEIIIINDGSKDRTEKKIKQFIAFSNKRNFILINQENKGKGAAMNEGLRKAKGDFFVCLDADSYPEKNILKKCLPYFEDPEVAIVLPLLKVSKTNTYLQKIQRVEYLINLFYKKLMSLLDCVHVSPGPFSIYRTEVIRKLGGFDEKNLVEDMEISLRVQKHQFKIVQSFDALVYTNAPKNYYGFYKQRNRWYKGSIINMIKYRSFLFNKKYGDFGFIQTPFVLLAGVLALTLIFITLYRIITPIYNLIIDLSYVKFDILTFLNNLVFNFNILDYNYLYLYLGIIVLSLGLTFIFLSHKYTYESGKQNKWSILFYLTLNATLLSFVWIGIAFDFLIGKIQKW